VRVRSDDAIGVWEVERYRVHSVVIGGRERADEDRGVAVIPDELLELVRAAREVPRSLYVGWQPSSDYRFAIALDDLRHRLVHRVGGRCDGETTVEVQADATPWPDTLRERVKVIRAAEDIPAGVAPTPRGSFEDNRVVRLIEAISGGGRVERGVREAREVGRLGHPLQLSH
jgi:hypothetical protein